MKLANELQYNKFAQVRASTVESRTLTIVKRL